jgi:hypothetical protein
MSKLKSEGAQAVIAESIGPAAGYTLAARAALGWNVPVVFDPAAGTVDITKLVPASDLSNATEEVANVSDGALNIPGVTLLGNWEKPDIIDTNGTIMASDSVGWDEVALLNAALKADGGSLSGPALAAAITKMHFTDPIYAFTQNFGFSANDHENVLQLPSSWVMIPIGPVTDGRVQPPAS